MGHGGVQDLLEQTNNDKINAQSLPMLDTALVEGQAKVLHLNFLLQIGRGSFDIDSQDILQDVTNRA